MEDFSYFQNQVNTYADGGISSDGSGAMENYSSGDSTHSGEFAWNNYQQPYSMNSSPSSNSESVEHPANCTSVHDCSNANFCEGMNSAAHPHNPVDYSRGMNNTAHPHNNPVDYSRGMNNTAHPHNPVDYSRGVRGGLGGPKLRKFSITSPSPQQVSFMVEPFLHIGPPSPWQLKGLDTNYNASPLPQRGLPNRFQFARPDTFQPLAEEEDQFDKNCRMPSFPPAYHPPRPVLAARPRLSTCDDPYCDLRRNGRDVEMDDLDRLQIRLRDIRRQQQPPVFSSNNGNGGGMEMEERQDQEPSLKRRLAQVRAMIREDLAREVASREARGLYGQRRRDRQGGKKCKFCLKKNEQTDIVSHHNLFDARGDVSCPILQQYRCDVCHATGKKAHTIKYCPFNNPETPHDVILEARWKVYTRNKQRE